jgi:hypothetical protein
MQTLTIEEAFFSKQSIYNSSFLHMPIAIRRFSNDGFGNDAV